MASFNITHGFVQDVTKNSEQLDILQLIAVQFGFILILRY